MINDVIVERVISPVCNTPPPPCASAGRTPTPFCALQTLPLLEWNSTEEAETKSGFL